MKVITRPCVYVAAALATVYGWWYSGFADAFCAAASASQNCSALTSDADPHAKGCLVRSAAPDRVLQLLCQWPVQNRTLHGFESHHNTIYGDRSIKHGLLTILAFLARPALWALVSGDIHHLAHVTAALLLLGLVVWPALARATSSVTHARPPRLAPHVAARLLLVASCLQTLRLPAALLPFSALGQALRDGRTRGFACLGWSQGLMLQVPLALQVPLGGLEWWAHDVLANRLDALTGAPPVRLQQRLLEALLQWVAPVAAVAWGWWRCRRLQPQQAPAPAGAALHPQHRCKVHGAPAQSAAAAGSSMTRNPVRPSSTAVPPRRSLRGPVVCGTAAAVAAVPVALAARVARLRHQLAAPAATPSRAAPALQPAPTDPALAAAGGGGAAVGVRSALETMLQWGLSLEGELLLPDQFKYTPVSQLMAASIKVQYEEHTPYTYAAGRVVAAVAPLMCRCSSDGVLVGSMATVPGCVLMLLDLIRPFQAQQQQRRQQQGEEEEQEDVSRQPRRQAAAQIPPGQRLLSDAAIMQGAWQVPVAAPVMPLAAATSDVGATAIVAGAEAIVDLLPLQQIGSTLTRALQGSSEQPSRQHLQQGHHNSRDSPQGAPNASPDPKQPQPMPLRTQPASATCCVIGTWGQELLLQLVPPVALGALKPAEQPEAAAAAGCVTGDAHLAAPPGFKPSRIRVVVVQQRLLLLDKFVDVLPSDGAGTCCLGLTLSCPAAEGAAPGSTVLAPLCVHIIPEHAALPAATINTLMLPQEAAAELVAWAAAQQLPRHQVAAWGSDLAVVLGVLQQLLSGGVCAGLHQRTVQLALSAASSLELYFEQSGCAAAADVVTLAKQRLLVRAMQAGQTGGIASGNPLGLNAAREASVSPATPTAAAAAAAAVAAVSVGLRAACVPTPPAGATGAAPMDPPQLPPTPSRGPAVGEPAVLGAWSSEAGSSSSATTSTAAEQPRAWQGVAPAAGGPSKPPGTAPVPGLGQDLVRQEAAAVLAGGTAGLGVCWRGFKDVALEEQYRGFRSRYLRGWDWLCRSYSLLQCMLLTRSKLQHLQATAAIGLGVVPGLLVTTEAALHVLLLRLAPASWSRHREGILSCCIALCHLLWAMEALVWPVQVLHSVYGSGGRLLLFQWVEFFMSLPGPWAALGAARVATPCGLLVLLVAADCKAAGQGGINAWLLQARQHRRNCLGWFAAAYGACNLLLAFLLASSVELLVRRAFVRQARLQGVPAT